MTSRSGDRRQSHVAGGRHRSGGAASTLQELAAEYSRTHGAEIQEEIVDVCWEWAARLGRGVARHSGVEPEVIQQVAGLALCKALARYDPELGEFEVFVRATIAGEVRHFLRSVVWPVHVPRVLQERYRLVARAQDELYQVLGCEPTSQMVADSVHLPLSQAEAAIGLRRTCASIDDGGEGLLAAEDDDLDRAADRVDLVRAVRQLSDADRRLLGLRFYQGFTQAEIAAILSTTQVNVSRMLTRALLQLSSLLAGRDTELRRSLPDRAIPAAPK